MFWHHRKCCYQFFTLTTQARAQGECPHQWLQRQIQGAVLSQRNGYLHHHRSQRNIVHKGRGHSRNLPRKNTITSINMTVSICQLTQSIISMATIRRRSSPTPSIMPSVMLPIHSISPSSVSASMSIKSAAKNRSVDHSTRANMASKSSMSASIIRNMAPSRAVQPSERRCSSGTECRKNKLMTNNNAAEHLISSCLFRMGYCKR